MKGLYTNVLKALRNRRSGAMVSIIQRRGSAPRREGAHLFLTGDGVITGTIGGGGLEAEAVRIARDLLDSEKGHIQVFNLVEGDDPSELVCGGNVTLLIEPILERDEAVYGFLANAMDNHVSCCLISILHRYEDDSHTVAIGPKGAVNPYGNSVFSALLSSYVKKRLVAWAQVLLKAGDKTIKILDPVSIDLNSSEGDMFIFETLQIFPRLIVFGGGHLSQALCKMAALCNFQVEIVDDRDEFASRERFPEATRVLCLPNYSHIPDLIRLDYHTFVVIATRGHRYDEAVLFQIIDYDLPYIGMVGSRQKNAIVFERLRERGISPSRLEIVHAPIGIPIRPETPEEIAISILAEIIQTRADIKGIN